MNAINDDELKGTGVAAIEAALADRSAVAIAVGGTDRFVVMQIDHYRYLRGCEMEAALAETRSDLAAGPVVRESPEAHVARLEGLE